MFKKFLVSLLLLAASTVIHAQTATCVVGTAGVAPSATLTFTAPTTNTDGTPIATPISYTLYASVTSGTETKWISGLKGSPILVNSALVSGSSASPLKSNTTVYFKITATDANGIESALSNEVCKSFPPSVPSTVTITIS